MHVFVPTDYTPSCKQTRSKSADPTSYVIKSVALIFWRVNHIIFLNVPDQGFRDLKVFLMDDKL